MVKDLDMSQPEIVRPKNSVNERDHAVGSKNCACSHFSSMEISNAFTAVVRYPMIKELQRLMKNDLYFVFRHFPTVQTHPHALRAAEATEAAVNRLALYLGHSPLGSRILNSLV